MYTKKSDNLQKPSTLNMDKKYTDRIQILEQHVRKLTEQVNRLHAELAYNSRNVRKQNTEIINMHGRLNKR